MAKEIETKILNVDPGAVKQKLLELGAEKILDCRMVVDWYGPKNLTHAGDDPWYLRLRQFGGQQPELSWKSLAKHVGNTRQSEEVNFLVSDFAAAGKFLEALGLEHYAHQEKDRISWSLNNWRFDLDKYPGMPAYLEIEGESEQDVGEAMALLNLQNNRALSEGERKLISEEYGLNWYDMKF